MVHMSVERGSLKIRPVRRRHSLRELLRKVTSRNLHEEIATGPPVGRESW
jgi:antitoxin component of MazEF toxin-antitoxin module